MIFENKIDYKDINTLPKDYIKVIFFDILIVKLRK